MSIVPLGYATYIPKDGAINIEQIYGELDNINDQMLKMLERAIGLSQDLAEKVGDTQRAAELLLAPQPTILPVINPDGTLVLGEDGKPVEPGKPAGRLEPVTDAQYAELTRRIDLLNRMIKLINEPIGNASRSYAQQVRASQRRWGV